MLCIMFKHDRVVIIAQERFLFTAIGQRPKFGREVPVDLLRGVHL